MQGFVKELGLKACCFPVWGYTGCKQRVFPKTGFPFVAGALSDELQDLSSDVFC